MRLSDVNNILVPVQQSKLLREGANNIDFHIDPMPENAALSAAMGSLKNAKSKAWLYSHGKHTKIVAISVVKVIRLNEVTFGKQNTVAIVKALMNTREYTGMNNKDRSSLITIKLRHVTAKYNRLTEKEGQNAVNIAMDVDASVLFPDLYCIGSIDMGYNRKWEFIGMESMDVIAPNSTSMQASVFRDAASLLRKLHRCNYVHGDSHIGNFMRLPAKSPHLVLNDNRIIIIDQDSILQIPQDGAHDTVFKFLVISDFNLLLLWNNKYVPFYNKVNQHAIPALAAKVYKKAARLNLVTSPWPIGEFNEASFEEVHDALHRPEYTEYREYLESVTLDQINDFYYDVFQSEENMRTVQKYLDSTLLS
jgi:hypothetical protein